jgi:hypothetical protein
MRWSLVARGQDDAKGPGLVVSEEAVTRVESSGMGLPIGHLWIASRFGRHSSAASAAVPEQTTPDSRVILKAAAGRDLPPCAIPVERFRDCRMVRDFLNSSLDFAERRAIMVLPFHAVVVA